MSDTKWGEVGGGSNATTWNHKDLKAGSEIEGRYIEKRTNIGPNKSNLYILEKNLGELWSVWGSTVIDAKFENIAMGKMVKIKFLGREKGKNGKEFKNYAFWQGIDVAGDEGKVFSNVKSGPQSKEEPVIDLDEEDEDDGVFNQDDE